MIHVKTHQAIGVAIYDALPRAAQSFLRFSEIEVRFWTRVPDEVAGDNILVTGGCAIEEAYAHSYKLARQADGTFKHLTGSAPTVLAQTPRLCRNAVREGRFDEAREHLGKILHYAVDLCTIWHLTRELTAQQHKEGELDLAKKLKALVPSPAELAHAAFALPDPKSLYRSAIAVAEETNRQQLDRCLAVQAHGSVTDDLELAREMVHRCSGFALSCALYVWKWMDV